MSDFAITRLGLSGPQYEMDRFISTCIRKPGELEPISFDFSGLIPMPEVIARTIKAADEETKQHALLTTGCQSWRGWSRIHWGTELNATSYREFLREPERFECSFETVWSYPEPVLRTLAAHFPQLTGYVFCSEGTEGWAYVGDLRGGHYTGTGMRITYKLQYLIHDAEAGACVPLPSPKPLKPLESKLNELKLDVSGMGMEAELFGVATPARAGQRIINVWEAPYRHLPSHHLALVNLADDAQALLEHLFWFSDEEPTPDELDDDLVSFVGSVDRLELFLQERRCSTPVDRIVIEAVSYAIKTAFGDPEPARQILRDILPGRVDRFDEGNLSNWASVAMYRSDRVLQTGGRAELLASVVHYGDYLLDLMIADAGKGMVALNGSSDGSE